MKDPDYRIPKHEISIWKENGGNIRIMETT